MNNKQLINVIVVLVCATLLALALLVTGACADTPEYIDISARVEEQRQIQETAHQMAECARALGHSEDDPIIEAAGQHWCEADRSIAALQKLGSYTVRERDILASVVMQEAPYCTPEHQSYVAQVVLNRVSDRRFPNTVERVVLAAGQYPGFYIRSNISDAAYDAAERAMMDLTDMPDDVVFQANFRQGKEVWKAISVDTGYFKSTTYFCR
jgi:hypothetical protein